MTVVMVKVLTHLLTMVTVQASQVIRALRICYRRHILTIAESLYLTTTW